MEIIIVTLVLVVLLVLFGGAGYFFVRETGWDNARLWITGPRQIRRIITPAEDSNRSAETGTPFPDRQQHHHPRPSEPGSMRLALDETALRNLREELHGELTHAAGITRDFDARLTRMEADLASSLQLPDEVGKSLQEIDIRTRKRLSKLRREVHTTRAVESPFSQRRSEALADLYGKLAQVETALAAVVNPMLLPGETLHVPEKFYDDTLEWSSWSDVGERAYSFGQVFNQTRLLLEPELADHIERFIATFRQALTDTVYPAVQNEARTTAQITQMRHGLENIVEALPPIRREIEAAYRAMSVTSPGDDDDDDD